MYAYFLHNHLLHIYIALYNVIKNKPQGRGWCLPDAPSACGGSAPAPAPTPTSGCQGNLDWFADRFCDDSLNNFECGYDGGDCCFKKKYNWDQYCQDCQCLGADCPAEEQKPLRFRNKYCHDEFNTPGCFYDGGDCCRELRPNWDKFCDVSS